MNILLGVTGSVSAYKAIELARLLVNNNHEVRVIVTKGAAEFINPNLFRYLGVESTYTFNDDFNTQSYSQLDGNVLHIELAKWCDSFVVFPLSANTLAKFTSGGCDDLLSSVFLALPSDTQKLLFPAMNTKMLEHPFVQRNLTTLSELPSTYVDSSTSGILACGDEGRGKLQDFEVAADLIETTNFMQNGKNALITTGATISALDPVRYLTNPSSGKTGYYLAKELLAQGYKVTVITSKTSTPMLARLEFNPSCRIIIANSTTEMKEAVDENFDTCDYYISAAAISDIEFDKSDNKIKKSALTSSIPISRAPDILKSVLEKRGKKKIIGFAAETSSNTEVFTKKLNDKPVDLLIGNLVNNGLDGEIQGFTTDSNQYHFLTQDETLQYLNLSKEELATEIANWMELN